MRRILNSKALKIILLVLLIAGVIALGVWGYFKITERPAEPDPPTVTDPEVKYGITTDMLTIGGGDIELTLQENAKAGETVTFTAEANEGYKISRITLESADGEVLSEDILETWDGKVYSFQMPACGVSLLFYIVPEDY